MDLRRKSLPDMNKGELVEILKALKIDFNEDDTNAVMVQRINESGKYKSAKEGGIGKIQVNDKGEKIHPQLGKYYDVIVTPIGAANQNTSIFAAINLYHIEFQPRTVVSLPAKVIKMLKSPSVPEHYFDKNKISDNGNVGAHCTRYIPKYIVERANEEL